jgi:hypothetical protein
MQPEDDSSSARFNWDGSCLSASLSTPSTNYVESCSSDEDSSRFDLSNTEKIFAPFRHENGTVEYYTAFSVSGNTTGVNEMLTVFYLTPLSDHMRPCIDFPDCTMKRCRFSHGARFKRSQVRKYTNYSFKSIKPGKEVLVRDI